jgi:hypothetical protein
MAPNDTDHFNAWIETFGPLGPSPEALIVIEISYPDLGISRAKRE